MSPAPERHGAGGERRGGPGGPRGGGNRSGGNRSGGQRGGGAARRGAGRSDEHRSGAPTGRSRQAPSQRAKFASGPRTVAFEALRAVDVDDAYANLVLPGLIRRARLEPRDAALATELTYGTLRRRGYYDAIIASCTERTLEDIDPAVLDALRLGVHQLLAMRTPPHAATSETVGLVRDRIGGGPAGFVNAVLRTVGERTDEAWAKEVDLSTLEPTERLARVHSHPAWIVRALREALLIHGRPVDELEALLEADNDSPKVTLVARPGRAEVAELVAAGAQVGSWSPYAAVLDGGDPARVPAVREQRARVQDEGSQLVALALTTPAGDGEAPERWLDLCAGPGGKTALLAALAAERDAHLTAVEITPHRADLVRSALTDGDPVTVITADGRDIGTEQPEQYDRVLVDAPCTGLGALRRRPEARWRRQPSDLSALAPLQRELLDSAVAATRPGGVIAYVTCSPHAAETVLVVEDTLKRHRDLALLDAPTALREAAGGELPDLGDGPTAQLWPHRHGTDAMFLALFRKI